MVKNGASVAGNEEIDEAVVVEVRRDRCRAVNVCRYARLIGYVGEGAVAVVAVEMVVRRNGGRLLKGIRMHPVFERLAADNVKIGQAVIVEIEPHAARARTFEQRAEFLRAEAVRELNARLCGGVFEANCVRRARLAAFAVVELVAPVAAPVAPIKNRTVAAIREFLLSR